MSALALALLLQASGADEAIRKGVEFLRTAKTPGVSFAKLDDTEEIVLLTFVHAGVPESDSKLQELLKRMLEAPIGRTYEAVLQAMILEELDRAKHQQKIAQCAQFLVDNQCVNGQWSYGKPSEFVKEIPLPKDVSTGGKEPKGGVKTFGPSTSPGPQAKPKVTRRIAVKKMKDGPAQGDNSNSQYAALGLRACHDAGILLPRDVLQPARKWWVESQHPADEKGTATGGDGPARGWCYSRKDVCEKTHRPYSSMTAGAVGALAIYDHLLEIDWKKDATARGGMAWLAANFSVAENVGPAEFASSLKTEIYYTLYAIERLGMLAGVPKIGTHDWYDEGARAILAAQRGDGSWDDGAGRSNSTWDTCYAILFLKKATRALVATGDDKGGK